VRSHPGLFGLSENGLLWHARITRKGAGTAISAVRSQAIQPFKAAGAGSAQLVSMPTAGTVADLLENF
jgi:hypothetical protein